MFYNIMYSFLKKMKLYIISILFFRKPTTRKGKKVLLAKEPKPTEGPKQCIFMHGRNPSETTRKILKNIYHLKKPDGVYLNRKNDFVPFEDSSLIEK